MLSFGFTYYACLALASVYPGYCSFRALRTKDDKTDDAQWLTYWVAFAAMVVFEGTAEFIVRWIPLYYEAKFLFILWLIAPQSRGAEYVYNNLLAPFLEQNAATIDPIFSQVENLVSLAPMKYVQTMVETHGPDAYRQIQT